MSNILEQAFDPEIFRKNGHALVNQLADYLKACRIGSRLKVLPWRSPEQMLKKWEQDFHQSPSGSFEELISKFIDKSIHLHHPKNMGHQVVPPAPPAILMDFLSNFLNNSMAVYEVGPSSSAIEKIVIRWVSSIFSMGEKSDGILTSGGSIGNLTALLAARQTKAGFNVWEKGIQGNKFAVMMPDVSHYSLIRAVKIMGLGDDGIIRIPVNDRMEVIPNELEACFQQAVEEGKQVIAAVGNACSTSTGSYDPLEEMAHFCRDHGLWFHVDAAHGGAAGLTNKYRHLIKGIELADSFVIDFHKMFLCPSLTTAVIFRDGSNSYETFSQKASYLLKSQEKQNWYDSAQRTLECTKKMMGIKVYALLKFYGPELFSDYVSRTYDLAKDFAEMIEETQDFQLAMVPASNIVCFRFIPKGKSPLDLETITQQIRQLILEDGEFYIVKTIINGKTYLRTTLMNPFTSKKELAELLEKIRYTYFSHVKNVKEC
jgi:L-2,4-diaminobutyrate decarboxylase